MAPVLLAGSTPLFEHLRGRIRLERNEVVESRFATHLGFRVAQ
jgi:hypothetical protein